MRPSHRNIVLQSIKDSATINMESGLKNWKNKLRNIGASEILDIAIIGDSISEGYLQGSNTATLKANAYKFLLDNYFAGKFENCGEGHVPWYYPTNSPQATFTGTWIDHPIGFVRQGKRTIVDNSTVSFPFSGPSLEIWTSSGTGGIIDVSIDGGAATRYTLSGTLAIPAKATIATGLSDEAHTCTITAKSGGNNFYFFGWTETKGTRGVRTHMCSKSGNMSTIYTVAGKTYYEPFFTLLAPDLSIVMLGTNDYMTNVVPATFDTNMRNLITFLQGIGSDVLIVTETNDRTGYTYQLGQYNDKLRGIAHDLGVALLDIDRKVGSSPRSFYFPPSPSTDIHPAIAGHSFLESELVKVIGN